MSERSWIISPQIIEIGICRARFAGRNRRSGFALQASAEVARCRPASGGRRPFWAFFPVDEIGTGLDFIASNRRETAKKAEIRCDMAHFCRNPDIVCATQSAPTRVS